MNTSLATHLRARRLRAIGPTVVAVTLIALFAGSSSASGANARPDASFGFFPRDVASGETVRFVSYACDPDGSLAERVWDLDNDGSFDDGRGAEVTSAFSAGAHTVRHRATDRKGAASIAARIVDVAPGIPEYQIPRPFRPPLLSPFPVVRLAGELTPTGAKVRLLTIHAPICSTVTVRCRGRTCPVRRVNRVSGRKRIRIRAFEGKRLRAGVKLEVLISKRDRIGKYTRFEIRRGRDPARSDACLRFGDRRSSRCPRD